MTTTTDPSGAAMVPPTNDSTEDDELSLDDLFFTLQNERRRLVLKYLSESEQVVEMRDVAEQVAAWEHDTTLAALTSDERQRVYIALYQSHLPKLDKVGLIDYNQSRGIIEQTERMEQIVPYLEADAEAREDERAEDAAEPATEEAAATGTPTTWERYFTGVTVFNMVLVGSVWAGVQPVASIGSLGLAALITAIYAALTIGMTVQA
jgi:hypothetical protein